MDAQPTRSTHQKSMPSQQQQQLLRLLLKPPWVRISRNVIVLSCESTAEGGVCDVYLESSREVRAIVDFLKPEGVFLELCSSRVTVLTLQNLKVPNMREIVTMLKKKHNMFEVLYGWFLAKIASKLEVFPGSDF